MQIFPLQKHVKFRWLFYFDSLAHKLSESINSLSVYWPGAKTKTRENENKIDDEIDDFADFLGA